MPTDKNAVRGKGIIGVISHKVPLFARPTAWTCARHGAERPRPPLVRMRWRFVRCAGVLGPVQRAGGNSPTGLGRILVRESNAATTQGSTMKLAQHYCVDPPQTRTARVDRACHDVNTSLSTVALCIEFLAERADAIGE